MIRPESKGVSVPVDVDELEDEFVSINSIILIAALLLLLTIGYYINTHRIKNLPESGVAISLGFVVGTMTRILGVKHEEHLLDPTADFGEFFFYVLLPPIIFEAGLSLQTYIFVDNLGAIVTYAVLGTFVSTMVVSAGLRAVASSGMVGLMASKQLDMYCHLFGALISATDPVAILALLRNSRMRCDPLLHSLINGESVLNDAVALVLFVTLSHHMSEDEVPSLLSSKILGHFAFVLVGSIVVGLGAGVVCSLCFRTAHALARFPDQEIAAILLGAYLTYAFAQLLGLSGIVALFFFGIVLSHYNWYNLSEASKVASNVTFGTLAKLSESCVFIYLGVVAALSLGRFHWNMGLVLASLVLIVVARAAHIFPFSTLLNYCGRERKISHKMQLMMLVSGLRGAIAFAMSLHIPCHSGVRARHRGTEDCRNSDLLVTTTISIVVLTTLVVGTAMERVGTALGLAEPSERSLSVPFAAIESQDENNVVSAATMGVDLPFSSIGEESYSSRPAPPEHGGGPEPNLSRISGMRGIARSFNSMRYAARGQLYQAFARFDLQVLQPTLGGPCRMRGGADGDELPDLQSYADQPGFVRLLAPPLDDADDAPAYSRSVIFE